MVKMRNFILHTFYHNKKMERKKTPEANVKIPVDYKFCSKLFSSQVSSIFSWRVRGLPDF